MKSKFSAIVTASILGVSVFALKAQACDGEAHASSGQGAPSFTLVNRQAAAEAGMEKATFKVKGMSCASCEKSVRAQLSKLEGVKSVTFRKGKDARIAEVTYLANAKVTPDALRQAIEKAGYQASLQ